MACSARSLIFSQNKIISKFRSVRKLLIFCCLSCKLRKHHALPFEINEFNSTSLFDLIHSDVWGPAPHQSMGGAPYFVIFIDDHTCFTWIYLMKHRLELPKIYIMFARMILTQFSKHIKILRANNVMEYKESSLLSFLQSQGTFLNTPLQPHLLKTVVLNESIVIYLIKFVLS